jgi:cohesin loading factor subunit SCC2
VRPLFHDALMSTSWHAPSGSSYAPEQRSADPVQDAHALLAVYPMASANPSTHGQFFPSSARISHLPAVTRHLSSLSLAGAPPSSLQPQYYAPYPPGNPPPYTEYPPEAQYLAADDSGYWESARGEASTMISQQVDPYVPSESTQDFFG